MNTLLEQVPHPALDELRQQGWAIAQLVGAYCVAFRGAEEVTLTWEHDRWRVVSHRTRRHAA